MRVASKGSSTFLISLLRFYVANGLTLSLSRSSPRPILFYSLLTRLYFQHPIKYPYYCTVCSFLIFHCVHVHPNTHTSVHTKGTFTHAHTHFTRVVFSWWPKIYRIVEAIIWWRFCCSHVCVSLSVMPCTIKTTNKDRRKKKPIVATNLSLSICLRKWKSNTMHVGRVRSEIVFVRVRMSVRKMCAVAFSPCGCGVVRGWYQINTYYSIWWRDGQVIGPSFISPTKFDVFCFVCVCFYVGVDGERGITNDLMICLPSLRLLFDPICERRSTSSDDTRAIKRASKSFLHCWVFYLDIFMVLAFYYAMEITMGKVKDEMSGFAIHSFRHRMNLFVCLFAHLKVVNQVIIVQTRDLYSNLFVFSKTFGSPENSHQQTRQPASHSFIYHEHR